MSCPDDNEIAALVQGFLDEEQTRRIQAHADGCGACMELLVDLAGLVGSGESSVDGLPTIGRYEVLEEIGSGAFGVVYAAFDPELQRRIAIKIIRPDRPPTKARLQREARLLASLSHPNIVPVFEVGPHRDGVFMVTELVAGGTLRDWLRQPRSRSEILAVFGGVAGGLIAAHEAGLIHRDVKPENVLIHADGRAVLTDFGLASDHTSAEHPGGTPLYMAPELLRGVPADARSDQFAFCVALYEALHGVPPFAGKTLSELVESANGARFSRGDTAVPARLDAAIHRGLAAEAGSRHEDMKSLWQAVDQATAPPRWPIAGAAVLAVALGSIGLWSTTRVQVPEPPKIEVPAPTPLSAKEQLYASNRAFYATQDCDEMVTRVQPVLAAKEADLPVRTQVQAMVRIAGCFEKREDCANVRQWYGRAEAADPSTLWRLLSPPCPPPDLDGRVMHLTMHMKSFGATKAEVLQGGETIRGLYAEPGLDEDQKATLQSLQLSTIVMLAADFHVGDEAAAREEGARANEVFDTEIDMDELLESLTHGNQ